MAEPARASADGPAAERPDPRAPGWADVQRAMITGARACAVAAAALARTPGDPAALAMADLTRAVLEDLAGLARRLTFDEQLLETERAAGFAAGVEACKAARRRLRVADRQPGQASLFRHWHRVDLTRADRHALPSRVGGGGSAALDRAGSVLAMTTQCCPMGTYGTDSGGYPRPVCSCLGRHRSVQSSSGQPSVPAIRSSSAHSRSSSANAAN